MTHSPEVPPVLTPQVSYVTQDTVTATFVKWGLSASALPNSATGTSELYAAGTSHK